MLFLISDVYFLPLNKDVTALFTCDNICIIHNNLVCIPNDNAKFVAKQNRKLVVSQTAILQVRSVPCIYYNLFPSARQVETTPHSTFMRSISIKKLLPGWFSWCDVDRSSWRLHVPWEHVYPHLKLTLSKRSNVFSC